MHIDNAQWQILEALERLGGPVARATLNALTSLDVTERELQRLERARLVARESRVIQHASTKRRRLRAGPPTWEITAQGKALLLSRKS